MRGFFLLDKVVELVGGGTDIIKFLNVMDLSQPSGCGRKHTLISIHAQTAAWQQSNGNSEARMSEKFGEWRD